jgi:UDP-glucose 4-epimerase
MHSEVVQSNVVGTLNLLEACRGFALHRFVYAGSCAEYGSGRDLTEEMLPAPTNVYGASKAAAGLLVQTYQRTYGLPTVWLRPFMLYGPMERRGRLVANTILTALSGEDMRMTGGDQERDFIYVDDAVEGFMRATDDAYPQAIGQTINLCSGRGLPIREVVVLLLELMGNPVQAVFGAVPYREGEMWLQSGDNRRAHGLLNWAPQVSLREGLERTIAWCMENRALAERLVT